MVHIEIRVLQILAHSADSLFDVLSIFALGVSEHHFGFVSFNIIGQVQLLVLIKHGKEVLVVLNTLTLVDHIKRNTFHHSLEYWDHLLREMLEFLALVIKFILHDWVIKMFFDF